RQWITDCSKSHTSCSSAGILPLWIIKITSSPNGISARLVSGQSQTAHYAPLSYRWGLVDGYVMSSANKHRLQERKPLQDLPRTFADAIEVAHSLGYSFLWIDAICITQDSKAEVLQQIGIMHQIFRGSNVTLFAGAGEDAGRGF
ncbi:hypothetical protein BU25DRAFT_316050, partial [Macroventuria anomochaeta]